MAFPKKSMKKPAAKTAAVKSMPKKASPATTKVAVKSTPKATSAKAPVAKAASATKSAKTSVKTKAPAPKAMSKKTVVAKKAPAVAVKKAKAAPTKKPSTMSKSSGSKPVVVLAPPAPAPAPTGPAPASSVDVVDAYMAKLDHPRKAEIEAVRRVIASADPRLSQRVKWNAPSFFYKIDFAAFNPRKTEYVHLIIVYPKNTKTIDDAGLLYGAHKDRREARFLDMADIEKKTPALKKVIADWMNLVDAMP